MLSAKSFLESSATSKKRLSRRERMESSLRLTGSIEFQPVNRYRLSVSDEKRVVSSMSTLPLRSTFNLKGG